MVNLKDRYVRVDEITWFSLGDKLVLHNLENDSYFMLNGTGRAIWELLDGENSITQVVDELRDHYTGDQQKVSQECMGFVDFLMGNRLVLLREGNPAQENISQLVR